MWWCTVENGKIVSKEVRQRGSNVCACNHGQQGGEDCHSGQSHNSAQSGNNHNSDGRIAIADCNVIIARGMGYGAYASLKSNNLEPIITDVAEIDQAVQMYLDGKLSQLYGKVALIQQGGQAWRNQEKPARSVRAVQRACSPAIGSREMNPDKAPAFCPMKKQPEMCLQEALAEYARPDSQRICPAGFHPGI